MNCGSENNISSRQKRKVANRSRHRLLSINRDFTNLKERVLSALHNHSIADENIINNWPWIPNKQCGSWYLPQANNADDHQTTEVYFKSTDGHIGTYAISLKRLNLQLLKLLHRNNVGCFLVDASVRKLLPDSFSRTIPIWCCVINRIVLKYRIDLGIDSEEDWDTKLYMPSSIISSEEHNEISNLIDSRVELLYQSKAVVDPKRLVEIMTKPVRAYWVANGTFQQDTNNQCTSYDQKIDSNNYFVIVCCNPSYYVEGSKNHIEWINYSSSDDGEGSRAGYYYTPGAADDESTWGRGLTPHLFWSNKDKLLNPTLTEDKADDVIVSIVSNWKLQTEHEAGCSEHNNSTTNADKIGNLNLWIGSRKSGRPPECWDNAFDAILNVTETEYPNMQRQRPNDRAFYYLQLPVAEGKRDKTELEKWLPVGMVFIIQHLQQNRRVLVHCAQGRDRSVAVVMALVTLVCEPVYPLRLKPKFESIDIGSLSLTDDDDDGDTDMYQLSGLTKSLVDMLLEDNGKQLFLKWMHQQLNSSSTTTEYKPFASKDSLRIVLHLVRQDRENAEPTRSTMQKLNRFFMSP